MHNVEYKHRDFSVQINREMANTITIKESDLFFLMMKVWENNKYMPNTIAACQTVDELIKEAKNNGDLYNVVGRSEQLDKEKLCVKNQSFKCNCIDNSKCLNFKN